jgi:ferritin-like metal-binding protein YciE
MSKPNLDEQLNAYLADAHSIEEQALAQLRTAPDIAGDDQLAAAFRQHLDETEGHLRRVRERLEARGGAPSRFKKIVMELGGKSFIWFARSQPDTPGKLTAHAFSYEAMEQASYEMLERVALRAGDEETAALARDIRNEERTMIERLDALFDAAVAASLRDQSPDDAREQIVSYLCDAHALEMQSTGLLKLGAKSAGDPELERLMAAHLEESERQKAQLEARLEGLGASPSKLKDAAMRMGALNWGAFFQGHPDTPGKLAVFAYAFEHLELAGYELLKRTATQLGDTETASLAARIADEERDAARRLQATFDQALDSALEAQGVAG